jgi:magnesium transporter
MMRNGRQTKRHSKSAGLPPGTLIHIGEKKLEAPRITVIDYDEQNFKEKQVAGVEECFEFKTSPTVTWINVDGIHDINTIEKIGSHYDLHSLTLEDILTAGQRPKFEDLEKYLFIVLNMLSFSDEKKRIQAEQVSMILGPNFVISFQESVGDVFEPIRDRIRSAKGRIRKMGPDYLMYSLMDAIVDNYFVILEKLGEKIESLEEELVSSANEQVLKRIHLLKREMIFLRKSVWPLRELISGIERSESELIKDSTSVYLRDLYDHTIQVIDTVEGFRDMVSGMLDIYLSALSNRMNAVMKVLTIIATIFIPLTFITGVYGMNFKYMPELQWKLGYVAVWLAMIAVTAVMLIYFKRKKWL